MFSKTQLTERRMLCRRTSSGVVITLLLLCSFTLFFGVELPEVNALALFSDDFANLGSWTVVNGV